MAENLDDGEFWLPLHFLSDDYTPINNDCAKNVEVLNTKNFNVLSPSFPSELSSPVEWSSETESNNDEYHHMADLTRHITHQLDLDLSHIFKSDNTQRATWDLLHEAAGEVEKMRLLVPPNKPSTLTQTSTGGGFYTNQYSLTNQQFQIAKFGISKEQEMEQQQGLVWGNTNTSMQLKGYSGNYNQWWKSNDMVENRVRNIDVGSNMGLSSSQWPHIQQAKQRRGCGMRAVNLGNLPVKRESIGTGVFLPRSIVHFPEKLEKKPALSNVTVQTRVLQAQDSNQLHHHSIEALYTDYESAFPKIGSNYGISQQKRNRKLQPPRVNHETQLPQEWKY